MTAEKDRLRDLISAILSKIGQTGKAKLARLVLFAEFEHFKMTGESITGLHFFRLQIGPVIAFFDEVLEEGMSYLWDKKVTPIPMRKHKRQEYIPLMTFSLSGDMQRTVDNIVNSYGNKTATELSILSHRLPAWLYSDPDDIIYTAQLAIDTEEKYFAMLDMIEEDDTNDELLEEEVSQILHTC
ncbi:MAG: Panacea domain-containing protein [Candidatus Magnetobacterium sp. LHC-1]